MKILCIGDSLGMPRPNVNYEDTWYYKLSTKYRNVFFIDKFRREMTSEALRDSDFYFSHYSPNVIIVQLGICDCSPRIINERKPFWRAMLLLSKKLKIESLFWKLIKKCYSRNKMGRVWVSFDIFKKNVVAFVTKMVKENANVKILFVGIGTPSLKLQERSPYLLGNIVKYNKVYSDLASNWGGQIIYIDPLNTPDDSFYVDGYHPNKTGHEIVFREIIMAFNQWNIC